VCIHALGGVERYHHHDVGNVQSPRGDIGRNKNGLGILFELGYGGVSIPLILVAVDGYDFGSAARTTHNEGRGILDHLGEDVAVSTGGDEYEAASQWREDG